jgi:alpha-mannosidase
MTHRYTFHLIANAHLDPVWLWDWREGLNEGIITCRTILDLMDEDPELTFIRGEAAVYQHIQRADPATFQRIQRRVKEGRWDVVGGTVIQSDTNLPNTETFVRQFIHGKTYLERAFKKKITVAWSADSFGHAAGLPEVYAHCGIKSFAFTRPSPRDLKISSPAFCWVGPAGSKILSYRPNIGWYGSERAELPRRLDDILKDAPGHGLHNVPVYYGLGNHGGGPTRRMLRDVRAWAAAHPEVKVIHSGLHRFFDALHTEARHKEFPSHRGELNFCLRGCYASALKFKAQYRRTEAHLLRAERTDAVISAALPKKSADARAPWDAVLFNAFHDILPGSSIERAYDDQLAWIGGAKHTAQKIEFDALNALASQIDTRVSKPAPDHPSAVAAVVWNPHGFEFDGFVELEAALDYRPIWKYSKGNSDQLPVRLLDAQGKPNRMQVIAEENTAVSGVAWRRRIVAPVKIPAFGWRVLEFGWVEKPNLAAPPKVRASAKGDQEIANGLYRIRTKPADHGIQIWHKGKPLFGKKGLYAAVFDDPWGSWGGMQEEPESLHINSLREIWKIQHVQILEKGPERAAIWMRLQGQRSWMELTMHVCAGREAIDISARVFWADRSSRLKLMMPGAVEAEFDVPSATVRRKPNGEVPGGRWVRAFTRLGTFGFASDALYCFSCDDNTLAATIVRSPRYASELKLSANRLPSLPAMDLGEHRFRFLIDSGGDELPNRALQLEQPPVVFVTAPHAGSLPRSGSFAKLGPTSLDLLAITPSQSGSGLVVRVRETTGRRRKVTLTLLGQKLTLGEIVGGAIMSWEINRGSNGRWRSAYLKTIT